MHRIAAISVPLRNSLVVSSRVTLHRARLRGEMPTKPFWHGRATMQTKACTLEACCVSLAPAVDMPACTVEKRHAPFA